MIRELLLIVAMFVSGSLCWLLSTVVVEMIVGYAYVLLWDNEGIRDGSTAIACFGPLELVVRTPLSLADGAACVWRFALGQVFMLSVVYSAVNRRGKLTPWKVAGTGAVAAIILGIVPHVITLPRSYYPHTLAMDTLAYSIPNASAMVITCALMIRIRSIVDRALRMWITRSTSEPEESAKDPD